MEQYLRKIERPLAVAALPLIVAMLVGGIVISRQSGTGGSAFLIFWVLGLVAVFALCLRTVITRKSLISLEDNGSGRLNMRFSKPGAAFNIAMALVITVFAFYGFLTNNTDERYIMLAASIIGVGITAAYVWSAKHGGRWPLPLSSSRGDNDSHSRE